MSAGVWPYVPDDHGQGRRLAIGFSNGHGGRLEAQNGDLKILTDMGDPKRPKKRENDGKIRSKGFSCPLSIRKAPKLVLSVAYVRKNFAREKLC